MHVEEHKSEAKYRNEQQKKKFCSSTTGDWDGVVVILWLAVQTPMPLSPSSISTQGYRTLAPPDISPH